MPTHKTNRAARPPRKPRQRKPKGPPVHPKAHVNMTKRRPSRQISKPVTPPRPKQARKPRAKRSRSKTAPPERPAVQPPVEPIHWNQFPPATKEEQSQPRPSQSEP
jgi:hypothetical protein